MPDGRRAHPRPPIPRCSRCLSKRLTGEVKYNRIRRIALPGRPNSGAATTGDHVSSSTSAFNRLIAVSHSSAIWARPALRPLKALRLQFPDPLASAAGVAYQACVAECMEVLGDGLARDPGAIAQACNREWSIGRQAADEPETRLCLPARRTRVRPRSISRPRRYGFETWRSMFLAC